MSNAPATATPRQTKYCNAIEAALARLGHATNAELLVALQQTFPGLSATTVHRATARLAARGAIATAPATLEGSMRYDTNTQPHDHFHCSVCDMVRDTDVKDKVIPILQSSIGGCHISGRLTISGVCNTCMEGKT